MTWSMGLVCLSLLVAPITIRAHPLESKHIDERRGSLLNPLGDTSWAQPEDHPAVALFRRQNTTGAAVGSDAWTAEYPSWYPDPTTMPAAWTQALANAENAGLIPNIALSQDGVYPQGVNASSPEVCSSTVQCQAAGDVWNAPDGMLGVSFDDGPTEFSPTLYAFLKSVNQPATHFFIGLNILSYPSTAQTAFENGDDLACHTWSHRYMTSLTNAVIVAEFAWTLKIISDITGGRIPKFWRPPYGDSDNRVRAIAQHIFGLTQVDWNQDTNDWMLPTGTTIGAVETDLTQWYKGPKSPGLIILEHELSAQSVQAFITTYPLIKANGWDARPIPALFGAPFYSNAANDNSNVVALNMLNAGTTSIDLSSTSSTQSATQAAQTASAASTTASTSTNHNAAFALHSDYPLAFILMSLGLALSSL